MRRCFRILNIQLRKFETSFVVTIAGRAYGGSQHFEKGAAGQVSQWPPSSRNESFFPFVAGRELHPID